MLHQPLAAHAEAPAASADPWTTRRFLLAIAAMWPIAAAITIALQIPNIAARRFSDVDDELRLVEVRDWMAGQAFRDVSQHRMNPPFGAPMHWSRLVDMPLAAVEWLLRPLIGALPAETAAAVIVPMVTLGVVMLMVGLVTRRLAGPGPALLAVALTPTALMTMTHLQPLRVDHHGWEIAFALVGLWALFDPKGWRSGLVAGAAVAVALQISLEPLPFAAALGGVMAARWAIVADDAARTRLVAYPLALLVGEALLYLWLHPSAEWAVAYCDAVSPPHFAGIAIAAAGCGLLAWRTPERTPLRWAALAATGAVAAGAFRAFPPHCGLDAFSALEPVVRDYWWFQVGEGQPIWFSDALTGTAAVGFPLLSLGCVAYILRDAPPERRADWLAYGAMLFAATLVGIFVLRASSLANAIALPAPAVVVLRVLARTRTSDRRLMRVFGSAGVLLLFSPFALTGAIAAVFGVNNERAANAFGIAPAATKGLAPLRVLGDARVLAPLDFGPGLLLETGLRPLASGHHRNHVAMAQEIDAWLGSDAAAERIVRARGIGYVLVNRRYVELRFYARHARHGFAAHMIAGRPPAWLMRQPIKGSSLFTAWRVLPAQPPAGSPSSRSAGGSVPASLQISRSAGFSPSS